MTEPFDSFDEFDEPKKVQAVAPSPVKKASKKEIAEEKPKKTMPKSKKQANK